MWLPKLMSLGAASVCTNFYNKALQFSCMTYKEKPVEHKVWILKPKFVKPCEQNKSKKVLVIYTPRLFSVKPWPWISYEYGLQWRIYTRVHQGLCPGKTYECLGI